MNYTEIVAARAERFIPKNPNALSKRETEVLDVLSKGRTNLQIGKELGISEKTVKNYMLTVFQKLGADNRAHAAIIAFREGLIT